MKWNKMEYGHTWYCNCEDCMYARGGEIYATCGCIVGKGCCQDEDKIIGNKEKEDKKGDTKCHT